MSRTHGDSKFSKLSDRTLRLDYRDATGRQDELIVKRRSPGFRRKEPPFRIRHPVAFRRIVGLLGLANLVIGCGRWAVQTQGSDFGMVFNVMAGVAGLHYFFLPYLPRWRPESDG
jgi:hypothetical protein